MRAQGPWVIVLAGGDGVRLRGAWVEGRRLDRPKQFCRFRGKRSLLQETLTRAERLTTEDRIVAVVREQHRRWWTADLEAWPRVHALPQAENRGTAVAILRGLVHALRRDENPLIVIMPSDHGVADARVLVESVALAAVEALEEPDSLVLLGMTPERDETGYGWIVPAGNGRGASGVSRFVEKPPAPLAAALRERGALWNSMIAAATASGLTALLESTQPLLSPRRAGHAGTTPAPLVGDEQLRYLPPRDFGRDVLEPGAARLKVIAAPPCGWTDLGTPERVTRWLRPDSRDRAAEAAIPHPMVGAA